MSEPQPEHEVVPVIDRPVEARRASRIGTQVWARVKGVDASTRARVGNISVTGLYIATEEAVGSPGDLVALTLSTIDKTRSASTMARVARVVRQDDRHRGAAVVGAGFEFLPVDHPPAELVELVRHATALALRSSGSVVVDRESVVRVVREAGRTAFARARMLRRDAIVLAVPRPLPVGDRVRVEPEEHGERLLELEGRVTCCEPGDRDGGHLATVSFGEDGGRGEEAVSLLVASLIAPSRLPSPPSRLQDFSGQLSRVHLSSVLTLAESVRLDGVITVASETSAGRIYVAEGRIVDAECDHGPLAPRDVVGELLSWKEGEFSVVCIPVKRAGNFERGAASLIDDLLRQNQDCVA
jgi:hypothetical protein